MPRSKPYTKKLGALDLILLAISSGGWFFVIVIRELYRHQ